MRLHSPYLFQKLQWIEGPCEFPQLRLCDFWNALCVQKSLAGCLRWMVALGDPSAIAMLGSQFERGLEEIHEQSRGSVQTGDGPGGSNAFEAAIPEQFSYDSTILLLDPRLVVLSIRSRAGELNPMAQAILDQSLIDKFAAIIHINCSQVKR
jgi:hypothetical protein